MFRETTINRVIKAANAAQARIERRPVDEIAIAISKGNRKIGRVMNVSLMPIKTCTNCEKCKHYCYDLKSCLQYPDTVINARMRNTVLAYKYRDEYFARIRQAISRRRKNLFFRWHVAGDIIDYNYLENMIAIARDFPRVKFWTYTKNYNVVNCWLHYNKALPDNLIIMFSEWDGLELNNPYNMPIFTCKLKAGNKNHAPEFFDGLHKCPGNCDVCKVANRGCIIGENTYADEH